MGAVVYTTFLDHWFVDRGLEGPVSVPTYQGLSNVSTSEWGFRGYLEGNCCMGTLSGYFKCVESRKVLNTVSYDVRNNPFWDPPTQGSSTRSSVAFLRHETLKYLNIL